MQKKNWWLRIGCFLTGHNYELILNSSVASSTYVKKNLSALIIISIVWGFVGYSFAKRYANLEMIPSIIVGIVMIVIIIQVERQIIMSFSVKKSAMLVRGLIGLIMAMIGSVIMDQTIFSEDIDSMKKRNIENLLDKEFPKRSKIIDDQLMELDSQRIKKEIEKKQLLRESSYVPVNEVTIIRLPSENGNVDSVGSITSSQKNLPNLKHKYLDGIDTMILYYTNQKLDVLKYKFNLRDSLRTEILESHGFLDDLSIIKSIITKDNYTLGIWLLFLMFFFLIELYILFNKLTDDKLDYDKIVNHQVNTKIKILENLSE